jgi:hypothetical protein
MAEMDAFDRGLESAFLRLVDEVPSEVDGDAVAHRVAREHPRGRVRGGSVGRVAVPGFAWLLLLGLLLAAIGAAALLAGGWWMARPAPATTEAPPAAVTLAPAVIATPIDVPPGVLSPSEAADRGVPVVTPSELGRISWTVWLPSDVDHSAIPLSTPHGPVILQGKNLIWRLPSGTWKAAPILGTASWPGAALGDDLFLDDVDGPARFHWTGSDWVRVESLEHLDTMISEPLGFVAGTQEVVAYGTGGVASSTDGTHFTPAVGGPFCFLSVVARGDGFVALGGTCGTDRSATVNGIGADSLLRTFAEPIPWTSTDGQTWRRAATASPFGSGSTILGVASHGDRQVAIGLAPPVGGGTGANALLESAVWVSDDGLAWRRLPLLPEAPTSLGASSWGTGFRTIVASDAGWLITAFDSSGMAWTSRDGLAWKPLHGQPTIWGGYLPPVVALGSDVIVVGAIGQEGVAIGTILGP